MKKLLSLFIALPLIYCGIWFYVAHKIKLEAHHIYEVEAPKNGYKFLGEKPKVTGFPAKHTITIEKGLEIVGTKIEFEKATISTIPLPGQKVDVNIKQLSVYDERKKQLYEIDNIDAQFISPKEVPATLTQKDLTSWQEEIGAIDFTHINLSKNSMNISAIGLVGLDENLQPDVNLKTTITDYDKLIHFMTAETSELSPIAGVIALSVLNGIAQENPDTGQKYVVFDFIVKDKRLTAGPLKSIKVPKIYWPE